MRLLLGIGFAALVCGVLAPSFRGAEFPLLSKSRAGADEKDKGPLGDLVSKGSADQMRFALGASQFLEAIEHVGQSLFKYGMHSPQILRMVGGMPLLPVPDNPNPALLTHALADQAIKDFVNDLKKAEQTLSGIKDDKVKLPIKLASIRLDIKGDGKRDVRLLDLMAPFFGGAARMPKDPDLLVVFDRGDVAWLRGYCHLLQALGEFILAHDARELFNVWAPLVFPKAETKYKFMMETAEKGDQTPFNYDKIVDIIATIHLIHLPVREPARMEAALFHLEQMVMLSKESWKFILAETDDDHEWIPNPNQHGMLGVPVTKDMVSTWMEFLDEADALLKGQRLVPFWRGNGGKGVNLRRVFLEPQTFDLVMWLQGAGAVPYLEDGVLTKKEVWERLIRVFRGEFIGFAFWFN